MGIPYSEVIERMKSYGKLKSDSAVAKVLGMTPQAMSNHKRRNEIPSKLVVRFADIYGVCVEWLLTGHGPVHKKAGVRDWAHAEQENASVMSALSPDEIIYSGKLLKILRGRDESVTVAAKHTIDSLFQYSELTEENNGTLDQKKSHA